jgi:hypothetical protein
VFETALSTSHNQEEREMTLTRNAQLDRVSITEPARYSFGAVFAVVMAAGVAAIGCAMMLLVKFLVLGGILVAMYAAFKRLGWLDNDDRPE